MVMSTNAEPQRVQRAAKMDAKSVVGLVLAALAIALLSTVSRVQTSPDASFSLFWPSAGLGLALLARFGLPGLLSAAVGVGLWAGWVMHWSAVSVVWTAVASAVGPWLTWYLVRARFAAVPLPFSRSNTVLAFMRAQAGAGSVLAAILGSAGLWFTGHWPVGVPIFAGVLAYWMIETTGAFLFAPVAWDVINPFGIPAASHWVQRFVKVVRQEWRYALMVLLLTVGVVALLWVGQGDYGRALLYGLLPLLVVVSLRASPTLVHVLILASGAVVLMTMAFLESTTPLAGSAPQLLLVALYLLVGTATLQVLLATSSEKRQALDRLERQAFVDAQTRLLNQAGLVRELEGNVSLERNASADRQVALIGLVLSNARQAASLEDTEALLQLDRHMADQLRSALAEVRWARVAAGHFQGVWVGSAGQLDPILSRLALLALPMAVEVGEQHTAFRAQWAVAAAWRSGATAIEFSTPAMLTALEQAQARAQQFRRVEVVSVDDRFLQEEQQEAAMAELVRRAIDTRGFLLYAQPIVPNHEQEWAQWQSGTAVVTKFEVLVRMADSQGQPMSPAAFMPAAMRAGLMPQLDLAVLEQTFSWLAAHPLAMAQLKGCAVNLSGPTVGDTRTVAFVK
ncbi:MAG: hypothetical protein RIR09_2324, partial [Pseudomonadota bacterium]